MIVPGTPTLISLSELLERVSQEEIARKYISNFRCIGKPFISDLRPDKRANSCFVFNEGGTGRLMYKDFADTKLPTKINLIEYVSIKYNLDFQGAVNKIAIDFNIKANKSLCYETNLLSNYIHSNSSGEEKSSSELVIKIKKRDWTKVDIELWNKFYIPTTLLERNNIKSISHLWLFRDNKQIFFTEFSESHPVFSYEYYVSNGIFRRKIYRPYSTNYKWMSNTDYTVVQNYPNVPKTGDLLFIQSSYKDCMVMEQLGYYAIAPNGESTWLPLEYWEKLKKRWKRIVIFGNNDWEKEDNPGLSYAISHSKRYGVPYIIIPDGETSDISDYVDKYNLDKGKKLTERLINDIYKK